MAELYPILAGAAAAPGAADEVGGKAWNLMRLAGAGLKVPPAFVLPTAWRGRLEPPPAPCRPVEDRRATLDRGIRLLEAATGLGFGASRRPLLVSVRSGAAVSMPGMMETVLDVGFNANTVEGLIRLTGNPRLAWDSYRRLIQGYSDVVAALPVPPFDDLVAKALAIAGAQTEGELDFRDLRALTRAMLETYGALAGRAFPDDPREQLADAVTAVFASWNAHKAVAYRRLNGIADSAGTAVTVQTMVYGNAGGGSGSGVAFTRNPATGAKSLYFDFQFNAQGEDVVAGRQRLADDARLRVALPEVWARLAEIRGQLEALFGDAQDFEFTVQSGVLFLLQTRRAKRTPWAAVAMAVDMVAEGLITPARALARLDSIDLAAVARTHFAPPEPDTLAVAQVASLGVASGAMALDAEAAARLVKAGPVILVRRETATSDIDGLALASGLLTGSGGRTSHAAVVARQLGKVCLVACPGLTIDLERRICRIWGVVIREGDFIALNGETGQVHAGRLDIVVERPVAALAVIAGWRRAASKVGSGKPASGKSTAGRP